MSADIVKLHQTDLDKVISILQERKPHKVLVIFQEPDNYIEYIAPTETSIYELAGWCQAVALDLMDWSED